MTHLPYEETRQQGTLTFPCTMYRADFRSAVTADGADGRFYVKPHWHDSFEILHFEKGSYEVGINMEHFRVEEEAFGFVGPGMIHTAQCSEGYLEQAVLFEPEILLFASRDAGSRELLDPFISGQVSFPLMIRSGEPGFESVKESFSAVRRIFEKYVVWSGDQMHVTKAGAQLKIKAGLLLLIAGMAENGQLAAKLPQTDHRAEAMKKVMTYVRDNYASRIYIADLARIMNMNEQYFCRLFRRTIGKTPVAYINEVRIREAAALMEQTGLSVAEAANTCGFGNVGHFISEFRRQTGCTPLEYRKKSAFARS